VDVDTFCISLPWTTVETIDDEFYDVRGHNEEEYEDKNDNSTSSRALAGAQNDFFQELRVVRDPSALCVLAPR